MKRKCVSCVLVASLLLSVGCYSTGTVTREELKEMTETDQADITVHMKDSREYKFSRMNYRIQGDTLFGLGILSPGGDPATASDSVAASIPFADMSSIETERLNVVVTIIVIAAPVAAVVIFFVAWGAGASAH
ncbi:MAG TPA: hypothetical protein VMM37_01530 [Bacteroidota bacterium]|nr:hypothetical protein [Bacteroidota bacterium]